MQFLAIYEGPILKINPKWGVHSEKFYIWNFAQNFFGDFYICLGARSIKHCNVLCENINFSAHSARRVAIFGIDHIDPLRAAIILKNSILRKSFIKRWPTHPYLIIVSYISYDVGVKFFKWGEFFPYWTRQGPLYNLIPHIVSNLTHSV